jgi:hypothetical protein
MSEQTSLLVRPSEVPVFSGPDSVRRGSKGRAIHYEFNDEDRRAFVEWPKQYMRKYSPLKSPVDGHLLTDDEIDTLLEALRHGWDANHFESTEEMVAFLKYRDQVPEKVYGMYESDISVCRFFTGTHGEKQENMLADIRRMNEEQGMGNIRIPETSIEIINYSPCPKCNTPHSFSDVFNYYLHPVPDPFYKTKQEQYALDTRVKCKECGEYFLPALIISDGTPKNETQMICRGQTMREVTVMMQVKFKLKVLTMKKENILEDLKMKKRAWRNDIDSNLLKQSPGLYANFLQYTPAPLMLDFISRKNLELAEPVYGAWLNKENVQYLDL